MKKIIFIGLFCFLLQLLIAQSESPYQLSWQVDAPIATAALGMGVAYIYVDYKTTPMSYDYINSLDRKDIWGFDRDATYNWSLPVRTSSDILMYSSYTLPFILLADQKIRKDYLKIAVIYAETFALAIAATGLTKTLVKRPRPYTYNEKVDWHYKEEKDAQYSFFSGHTSTVAAVCFMTAKVFNDYNKGNKAVPWVWAAAAVVPAVAGILRQQSGQHFWTDIISGYAIGAAIGILVPELHRIKVFKKKKEETAAIHF